MLKARRYIVHSCHETRVEIPAKTNDGRDVVALMPAAVIELVPIEGGQTVTLTEEIPADEDRALVRKLFAVGATVEDGGWVLISGPPKRAAAAGGKKPKGKG